MSEFQTLTSSASAWRSSMRRSFIRFGSTASGVRAGRARIFSNGARSTPRHCASTRWRLEVFFGGGIGKQITTKTSRHEELNSTLYFGAWVIVPNDVLRLSNQTLRCKVVRMKPDWAEENLQTIRTLMERSALYRRALAPIMLFAGVVGLLTMGAGIRFHMDRGWDFFWLWFSAAIVAIVGALLIARQQALKDKEVFWSPPTRRVAQALAPPLLAGLCFGILFTRYGMPLPVTLSTAVAFIWILFYGCALHAAGFFMPRGIKFFGWLFIASSCGLFFAFAWGLIDFRTSPQIFMGFFFGVLHLAYGAYLYLTERKNPVA